MFYFEGAWGLKIHTSKYVFSDLPPHIPLAEISNLAPSCELAVAPVRCSVVTACSSGSMRTSLHGRSKRSGWSGFGRTSFHVSFEDCACADDY